MAKRNIELKILAERERWKKSSLQHGLKIKRLIEQLGSNCTHSEKHWGKWEHDNGYGQQTWLKRWTCEACGYEKLTYERA